jgi:hypothetical protein
MGQKGKRALLVKTEELQLVESLLVNNIFADSGRTSQATPVRKEKLQSG